MLSFWVVCKYVVILSFLGKYSMQKNEIQRKIPGKNCMHSVLCVGWQEQAGKMCCNSTSSPWNYNALKYSKCYASGSLIFVMIYLTSSSSILVRNVYVPISISNCLAIMSNYITRACLWSTTPVIFNICTYVRMFYYNMCGSGTSSREKTGIPEYVCVHVNMYMFLCVSLSFSLSRPTLIPITFSAALLCTLTKRTHICWQRVWVLYSYEQHNFHIFLAPFGFSSLLVSCFYHHHTTYIRRNKWSFSLTPAFGL